VEVIEPSPLRVEPRCEHFGVCGGCAMQHLDGKAQIQAKEDVLRENFRRIGKVDPQTWLEPLVDSQWGYRRRARLSVKYVHKKGRVLVGFRERDGRFVADLRSCPVLIPEVGERLLELSELVFGMDGRTQIPQIEIASGDQQTLLVIRHLEPLSDADIKRLKDFSTASGLGIVLQAKGPNSLVGLDDQSLELSYRIESENLDFQFTPTNFVQVNAGLNQLMVARALEKLALSPSDRVLDLFCGLGNFTLPIARHAASVVGIEGDQELVELARLNADKNSISNAEFHLADLTEDQRQAPWYGPGFDKVLIDPPRSGALEVLPVVAAMAPQRIVYISCHPGSLARDAGLLIHDHGYQLLEAGVMDMFPHTAHVESIAVFEKA
jgi:23S rRNA (uracil1939-C5)-methyltransferase